jgi:quinolinate synthase
MAALALDRLTEVVPMGADEIVALQDEVRQLARARNAVILAHNYQVPEVQDVADFVGDSLGLAIEATNTSKPVIVMCGVYFMAETAKILNMGRTVLIPDPSAGCSLADSITLQQLKKWKAEHPGGTVVSYVNTTAAIKAESDYCVTSGNAEAVVRSIPESSQILFLPDLYLGTWLKERTGRSDMLIWPGECHVHAGIRVAEMRRRLDAHSGAEMLIHPECGCTSRFVHATARGGLDPERTFVLSTEGMVKHARASSASTMIVATENGLLHRLAKEAPGKTYIPADEQAICRYMKQITLPKLRDSLLHMYACVEVEKETADRARTAIERMLAVHA